MFTKYFTAAAVTTMFVAPYALAGRANIQIGEDSVYTAGLVGLDSITFPKTHYVGEDTLNIQGYGLKAFKPIGLKNVKGMTFDTRFGDNEKLNLNVTSTALKGSYSFNLSDVKSVETAEVDPTLDTDGDGIPDYDEIFKFKTNPYAKDTDGDGFEDGEELFELFNPENPTVWNPNVADLPKLEVTMTMTPSITLNRTTSSNTTKTVTISEGESVKNTQSISFSETESAALMSAWNIGFSAGYASNSGQFVVNWGYNGSYTESEGHTLTENQSKAITQNYNKAVAEAMSEGESISGGTLSMQARITNTGKVAYSIENLILAASTYTLSGDIKIIAELAVGDGYGEDKWTRITLAPGESKELKFWKSGISLDALNSFIFNPGAIFLSASAYKITLDRSRTGMTTDFTEAYTKVSGTTARVTFDKGAYYADPRTRFLDYRVSTNFKVNRNANNKRNLRAPVYLSEFLDILQMDFEQDTVMVGKDKRFGLVMLDGVENNIMKGDTAVWFVAVNKAATPERTNIYSVAIGNFNLDSIVVGAGDVVQFIYNEDRDHDGVPASMEKLLGTRDDMKDTDGDGISDFDEINGWTKNGKGPFVTDPTLKDTDGDGVNDGEDENPVARPISSISVVNTWNFIDESHKQDIEFRKECKKTGAKCAVNGDSLITTKDVHGAQVAVKLSTVDPVNAEDGVVVFKNGVQVPVTPIGVKGSGKNAEAKNFKFTVDKLVPFETAEVKVVVTAENGNKAAYYLNIPSSLNTPQEMILGRNADRNSIIVNYIPDSLDTRILGYVVVRAEYDKIDDDANVLGKTFAIAASSIARIFGKASKNDEPKVQPNNKILESYVKKPTTVQPKVGDNWGNGIAVVALNGRNDKFFTDKVGGGSPYYTYRVFAYAWDGKQYVFSEGSKAQTRAVGRVIMKIQNVGHGTEYQYKAREARVDHELRGLFKNGNRELHEYKYYFSRGGSVSKGNTIHYESKSDSKISKDDNAVEMDRYKYTYDIGKGGLTLFLSIRAQGGGTNRQTVDWPYEKIAQSLNDVPGVATSKNGDAPKNDWIESKFNFGSKGVSYSGSDACSGTCGHEPRGGLKFKFKYVWADED